MRYRVKARPIPPKVLVAAFVLMALVIAGWVGWRASSLPPVVHDFNSCIAAGNPVLESYPEQCVYQGQSYINPSQNVPKPF
jgi:hypothetical protein